VTDTYAYDAFGNLIMSAGGTANNYLFAGEQFDPNLGGYYLRQRYYNPGVGRFTRRDTYEGSLEDSMSLHKYLYAHANPVNFTDPTGLFTMADIGAANAIRDILMSIQLDTGSQIIQRILGGEEPTPLSKAMDVVFGLGFNVFLPIFGSFIVKAADDLFETLYIQRAIGIPPERIAGFIIDGNKGLVGKSFMRNIFYLGAEVKGRVPITVLLREMEQEARVAGAEELRIIGHYLINDELRKVALNEKLLRRMNFTGRMINPDTIELVKRF